MIDTEALRKKVIDLAIQGKLTEQLPSDGDAETLYAQILDHKSQLIKEGKIKKDKALPDIAADEIPFEIPDNWKWVRVNSIGSWSAGATPSRGNKDYYDNGTIPWLKTGELNDGYITEAEEHITQLAFQECSVRINPIGSVLIAMYGATIGKVGILDIEATTNQACCACIPYLINNRFLFYFLKSNKERFLEASHGGAQPNISKDIITKSLMPLPPLAEQKRIVEVLDCVFNQFEVIDNLQAKYSNDLAVLKSKIIDAGIQGKLTEQLPEDGDAEELIARISEEKEKLIRSGKIPKEKKLPEIADDEKPYTIPNSWRWVRVQDVASYITDYVANGSFATLKEHTKTYKEPNYAIFVRTMDFGTNFKEGCSYIDKESYDFLEKSKLFGGELILPNIGASIGKAFIMPDLGMPMSLAPNSILLKFTEPVMNEYFSFVIKSTYGAQLLNKTQGGSATAKFSKTDLRTLAVPLPPLNEIKRIVEAIKNLSQIME